MPMMQQGEAFSNHFEIKERGGVRVSLRAACTKLPNCGIFTFGVLMLAVGHDSKRSNSTCGRQFLGVAALSQ